MDEYNGVCVPYFDALLKTHSIYRLYSNSTYELNSKQVRVLFIGKHLAEKRSGD